MLSLQKWPIESSNSQRRGGWHPSLPPQGELCPVGTGLHPSPTGWERTTFPYKAPTALPRLDALTDCSFPFSLPSSSAGLECSPCCQAPPLLHGPHPIHFHSLPEPASLSWINSPKASPKQGLPGSGLLEAAQGSRMSKRTQGSAAPQWPYPLFEALVRVPSSVSLFPRLEKRDLIVMGSKFFKAFSSRAPFTALPLLAIPW